MSVGARRPADAYVHRQPSVLEPHGFDSTETFAERFDEIAAQKRGVESGMRGVGVRLGTSQMAFQTMKMRTSGGARGLH